MSREQFWCEVQNRYRCCHCQFAHCTKWMAICAEKPKEEKDESK